MFTGGRTSGNVGGRPGIHDEYKRFLKHHPQGPAYLLGTLSGETTKLIERIRALSPMGPRSLSRRERELMQALDSVDFTAVAAEKEKGDPAEAESPTREGA